MLTLDNIKNWVTSYWVTGALFYVAYHNEQGDFLQIKVTMAKSAQDKVRRKKKEEKEHNHKEHQEVKDLEEKEENPWERLKLNEAEKVTPESED